MRDILRSEDDCRKYLEYARWQDEPICPKCGCQSKEHYRLKHGGVFKGLYKCKDCKSRFTVRVGTMFEGSHIPLKKWFEAIFIFLSHKKGISSVQLHRDIEVTQKTAWFMLDRIRYNLRNKTLPTFDNITQVDETYVGGKNRNRNIKKRLKRTQGRSLTKTPVMGLLSDGKVYTTIIPNASSFVLKEVIYGLVNPGSIIVTDGWKGYKGLSKDYIHKVVDHAKGVYVKDGYHTNGIEGFWSHLKRGIIGVYHVVSPKRLALYCYEFVYRYNTRHLGDGARFFDFISTAYDRLTYRQLVDYLLY